MSRLLQIFDLGTNQILVAMNGHKKEIQDLVFSPNGKRLFTSSYDSTVKVWNAVTGELLRTFGNFPASTASISISPDGRTLAMTTIPAKRVIYLLDAETGKILHVLRGGVQGSLGELSIGERSHTLLTARRDIVTFASDVFNLPLLPELLNRWDFASISQPITPFKKKLEESETSVFHTKNDTLIAGEYSDSTAIFWNTENGKILQSFRLPSATQSIMFLSVSKDKSMATIVSTENCKSVVRLFDMRTGKLRWIDSTFNLGMRRGGNSMVFSPNDSVVFALRFDRSSGKFVETLVGYHTSTGKILYNFPAGMPYFIDNQRFTWTRSRDTVFNLQTSQKERFLSPMAQEMDVERIEYDILKAKKSNGDSLAIHIPSGRILPTRFISDFNFTIGRDGKYAFKSNNSSTLVVDISTGRDLCNLYTFDNENWAVTTPDGRFDGSEGGLRYLHFVVGNEPIELEQLKERYYEPGLLSKLMGYNNEPLREIERFEAVKMYPLVIVQPAKAELQTSPKTNAKSTKASPRGAEKSEKSPSTSNLTFSITLQNQGGGIGRVPVWLNGKELTDDARPKGAHADAPEITVSLSLEGNRLLLPGTANTLTVRAFNGENAVLSRSTKIEFQAPGERLQGAPHLYAVIAGTSDYQGEELDLPFASNDAEQIAKAVQIASERLLGTDKVHITLLAAKNDSTQSKTRTTKTNLVNALKAVQQKATANDILFVYLTGHGINWGGQDGDWYYLTCDARLGDDEKFADAALRAGVTLSSHELTDLMRSIPARKQTLALDACASGKAVENLLASRDVPSSQLRAMMRMKDRAGLHVISGCASNAVSYEASRYGQGLLTYSLLMGIKGGALRDNQFVDVKQLFEFAADRVPELARDIGRVQKPQVCSPFGGGSFDIGLITASEAAAIPLADAKPLFVRANFQDDRKMYDQLNLGKIVNESLRGVTYRAATNPFEAWLVYLDVPEFPNSYSLNGRYTIKGDEIMVSAVLRRGEEEGTVFTVKGAAANVKELAQTLVSETKKRMK
jgi:WD40 repeat protein